MDDLILEHLNGQLTPEDARRFEEWRRASPMNESRVRELSRIWDLAAREDPYARLANAPPSLDALLRMRDEAGWRTPVPGVRGTHRRWWMLAGAGMVAAAGALVFTARAWVQRPAVNHEFSASEFVTDTVEMVTARLDDGSVVRLAPQSRLRVTPSVHRREVWLDGEAFFAVVRDSERPFTVRTRAGEVEVLGTRFDVRVVGAELRLVVTEGQVAITAGNTRRIVVAGQVARVENEGVPVIENIAQPEELLGWMRGFLVFQNTPLHQVARELEQRYGVRVLLPDSGIAARTVTAWFTHQKVDQVLEAVCRAVDAHCTLRAGVASIEP